MIFFNEVFKEITDGDYVVALGDFFDVTPRKIEAEFSNQAVGDFFGRFDFGKVQKLLQVALVILAGFA